LKGIQINGTHGISPMMVVYPIVWVTLGRSRERTEESL